MPVKRGTKQNREKAMDEDELRVAYLKVFLKYAVKGIRMYHPESLQIFQKRDEKGLISTESSKKRNILSQIVQKVSE